MNCKKSRYILLVSISIWMLYVMPFSINAETNKNLSAYTHASMSNLRVKGNSSAQIIYKLPINTMVKIIKANGDWLYVLVIDKKYSQGWLHKSVLGSGPLTLEESLDLYKSFPDSNKSNLTWIERAAAIAPEDIDVLKKLASALRQYDEVERADQVVETITGITESLTQNIPLELWEYFRQLIDSMQDLHSYDHEYPVTPKQVSEIIGVPIFLSGPHKDNFSYSSHSDFGHYNPEFIAWAKTLVAPKSKTYYFATKPIFDKYVRWRLRKMLEAYQFLESVPDLNKKWMQEYQNSVSASRRFNSSEIYNYNSNIEQAYALFWLRRQMDGTSLEVKELFETIAKVYDPKALLYFKTYTICPCDNTIKPWAE